MPVACLTAPRGRGQRRVYVPGATSIVLTDLASRSTLNWVVRARDAAGNRDSNLVEKSGLTIDEIRSRSFAAIMAGRRA